MPESLAVETLATSGPASVLVGVLYVLLRSNLGDMKTRLESLAERVNNLETSLRERLTALEVRLEERDG